MKRYILSALFLLMHLFVFAQTKGINYQAVILDPNPIELPGSNLKGQPLASGKVCLRFSFISAGKVLEYEEIQRTTTDEFGLVNLVIGSGNGVVSNSSTAKTFGKIFWDSSPKTLQVSVSFDDCSSFLLVSSQPLNATPIALYAESVDYKNIRSAPTSLSQFSNDVGFLMPKDLDPIKSEIKLNSNQIELNNKNAEGKFLILNQTVSGLEKNVNSSSNKLDSLSKQLVKQDGMLMEQSNRINANQAYVTGQISNLTVQTSNTQSSVDNLGGTYESLSNKSNSTDLGNSNPSNSLYPTQLAVKSYIDASISQVSSSGTPDATTLAAGKLKLAGDLGGTASSPTVPALGQKENVTNKSTDVSADASSDTKYPTVRAVKTYVDQATAGIALQAAVDGKADKNSPALTGVPTAPTPISSTNTTQIATTAFVQSLISSATIVDADATTKGKIQLTGDLGGTAASPTVPGLSNKENSANKSTSTALGTSDVLFPTQNAVKTYVDAQIASGTIADASSLTKGKIQLAGDLSGTAALPEIATGAITSAKILDGTIDTGDLKDGSVTNAKIVGVDGSKVSGNISGNAANISASSNTSLTSLANLATVGTITTGTWNGTTIAVANGGTGATTAPNALINLGAAPLASPALTGVPTAPTAISSTNTTQIATTAFVQGLIASGTIVDADATTKGKIQLAGDLGGTAASPTVPGLSNKENTANKSTSTALGTSDVLFPTQNAVKTYVDAQIASGTIADASSLTKGKIQLAGDLSGTAAFPEIATGAITSAKILDGTIDTGDLKDGSVTNAKIVGMDGSKVSGNISGNAANISASSNTSLTSLANLATVGTITTGTWNGTTIAVANGGTGVTTLTGIVKANGTSAYSAAVSGTDYSLVREVSDEFTVATDGDTQFTLTQTKATNSKLKMYVNGIHISKNAFSLTGVTLTYDKSFNGNYVLKSGDRVQFEYYY